MKRARTVAMLAPDPAVASPLVARLWTQREAAAFLGVSTRYLRDSSCPKILLPGSGRKGNPLVRYDPADVRTWVRNWHTSRGLADAKDASYTASTPLRSVS